MLKAFVSKVETLSDQSVKLSLHAPKELLDEAFRYAYQEVNISGIQEVIPDMPQDRYSILLKLLDTFEKGIEILKQELQKENV